MMDVLNMFKEVVKLLGKENKIRYLISARSQLTMRNGICPVHSRLDIFELVKHVRRCTDGICMTNGKINMEVSAMASTEQANNSLVIAIDKHNCIQEPSFEKNAHN